MLPKGGGNIQIKKFIFLLLHYKNVIFLKELIKKILKIKTIILK